MILNPDDAKIEAQLPGVSVDDPIKSRVDLKTTRETIKKLLANGTPDWFSHPEDYKNFVKESFQAEKEKSDALVADYRMEDQEILIDRKSRMVNPKRTRDFLKTLRDNGVKCFTIDCGLPGTVGLWCAVATDHGLDAKYICFVQIPAMFEWSVLRLDAHSLPAGEAYRGWRTVLLRLIEEDVITEQEAHKIFGKPIEGIVSRRYRRNLRTIRMRKKKTAAQEKLDQQFIGTNSVSVVR